MESESSKNVVNVFQSFNLSGNQPVPAVEQNTSTPDGSLVLSKRARKRKMKAEKWMETKHEKRARERQRLKKRSLEAKLKGVKIEKPNRKALKKVRMATSRCDLRVVLDFSFDNKMILKDLHRLVNQTLRVYSANRRVENPLQVFATSFTGPSSVVIAKHDGYGYWDINFKTEDYLELFKKEDLVYLTSDSENVIRELDNSKVYIIGALVDHNSLKGECYKKAVSQGIQHGRLPLDDHVLMKTRKVLTVDQVFHIIALVAGSNKSWDEALMKVIPQRKGAVPKGRVYSPGEKVKRLADFSVPNHPTTGSSELNEDVVASKADVRTSETTESNSPPMSKTSGALENLPTVSIIARKENESNELTSENNVLGDDVDESNGNVKSLAGIGQHENLI